MSSDADDADSADSGTDSMGDGVDSGGEGYATMDDAIDDTYGVDFGGIEGFSADNSDDYGFSDVEAADETYGADYGTPGALAAEGFFGLAAIESFAMGQYMDAASYAVMGVVGPVVGSIVADLTASVLTPAIISLGLTIGLAPTAAVALGITLGMYSGYKAGQMATNAINDSLAGWNNTTGIIGVSEVSPSSLGTDLGQDSYTEADMKFFAEYLTKTSPAEVTRVWRESIQDNWYLVKMYQQKSNIIGSAHKAGGGVF